MNRSVLGNFFESIVVKLFLLFAVLHVVKYGEMFKDFMELLRTFIETPLP